MVKFCINLVCKYVVKTTTDTIVINKRDFHLVNSNSCFKYILNTP